MHQVKKGNQYHFGMKLHIGVDAVTGLVHSLATTPANVHDVTETHRLLHGGESRVWGDAGYVGVQKRGENQELTLDWQVATQRVTDRMLDALSLAGDPSRWAEKLESYRSAGVDLPCLFISPSGPDPIASTLNSVRALKG